MDTLLAAHLVSVSRKVLTDTGTEVESDGFSANEDDFYVKKTRLITQEPKYTFDIFFLHTFHITHFYTPPFYIKPTLDSYTVRRFYFESLIF